MTDYVVQTNIVTYRPIYRIASPWNYCWFMYLLEDTLDESVAKSESSCSESVNDGRVSLNISEELSEEIEVGRSYRG